MHRRSDARLRHGNLSDRPRRHVFSSVCVVAVMLVAVMFTTGPGIGQTGDRAAVAHGVLVAQVGPRAIVPPNHPVANVQSQVGFNCSQSALDDTAECIYSALLNINYARSLEGVGPMILPSDYAGLAPAQQLFVVFNLERTGRGLPALTELDASADNDALSGALGSTDPAALGSSTFQAGAEHRRVRTRQRAAGRLGVDVHRRVLPLSWATPTAPRHRPTTRRVGITATPFLATTDRPPAAGAAEARATSGPYPGLLTWTAEFGESVGAVPNPIPPSSTPRSPIRRMRLRSSWA